MKNLRIAERLDEVRKTVEAGHYNITDVEHEINNITSEFNEQLMFLGRLSRLHTRLAVAEILIAVLGIVSVFVRRALGIDFTLALATTIIAITLALTLVVGAIVCEAVRSSLKWEYIVGMMLLEDATVASMFKTMHGALRSKNQNKTKKRNADNGG